MWKSNEKRGRNVWPDLFEMSGKCPKGIVNNNNFCNHAQMYFLALYLKKHIELILLCCVYSAININFGAKESKGAKHT